MSDAPDNLILAMLRRIDANVSAAREDIADMKQRLTGVELQLGQSIASEQSHYAAAMARFDRLETRLDRLERRVDIVPA